MNFKKVFQLSSGQFGFLATVPALLFIFILLFYPMVTLINLSFKQYTLTIPGRSPYVGLEQFARAFSDPDFFKAMYNTLYFTFFTLLFELLVGLGVAWLMTRTTGFLKILKVVRGLLLLPWMLTWVAVGIMWAWILNADFGIINHLIVKLGLVGEAIFWLGDRSLALNTLVGISVWKQFPVSAIFLIAGFQSIPHELFEAARIDGAGAWYEFRYIALPLLRPVILLLLILRTTFALRIFDLIYVTTGGGPAGSTEMISTYIYDNAFTSFNLGFASALSVILLIITLIISVAYIMFLPKAQV